MTIFTNLLQKLGITFQKLNIFRCSFCNALMRQFPTMVQILSKIHFFTCVRVVTHCVLEVGRRKGCSESCLPSAHLNRCKSPLWFVEQLLLEAKEHSNGSDSEGILIPKSVVPRFMRICFLSYRVHIMIINLYIYER